MADLQVTFINQNLSSGSVPFTSLSEYGANDNSKKVYDEDSRSFQCLRNFKESQNNHESCRNYSKISEFPSAVPSDYSNHRTVVCKSNSLPGRCNINSPGSNSTLAFDIPPEDLASQLTLLDIDVFKRIKPEELSSCAWNKKSKLIIAPNVVSFTRRFNHVSFWTVQEILNGPTPKQRSETLIHFIKVAKKLYDLNNLHSLFAIISALQSASVYRLNKTWAYLSKKDKSSFDKLSDVFSDKSNWKNLRDHMKNIQLPCIPYLGLFLTDIVYIDMAHPVFKSGINHQRTRKIDIVLTRVAMFQNSKYSGILPLPNVQRYLISVRYIEELQKFLEDDHFKLSIKLEPNSLIQESDANKESEATAGVAALSLSPARGCAGSLRLHAASTAKFVPGHRKCRSLGTNIFGKTILPTDLNHVTSRHLLDDSVLEESQITNEVIDFDYNSMGSPADVTNDDCSLLSRTSHRIIRCNAENLVQPRCTIQGSLKRKVVLRNGRKPTISTWQRYWIQIWASSIVYFSPRCFKGNERADFKREPQKMVSILGWIVESLNDTGHTDSFLLVNPKKGNVYKFRSSSSELSNQWFKEFQATTRGVPDQKTIPANLISFE